MPVSVESDAAVVRCAYCDAPILLEPLPGQSHTAGGRAVYCCYGCRLLGESGGKPLPFLGENVSSWFKIMVGALIAGQAMLLGLAINLSPPSGSARWLLHLALIVSSLAACAILGPPLAQSAWSASGSRRISIDLLFVLGILGAFGASLYSTLTGMGAVYYEVVAVLLTVYATGKALGAHSRARAFTEARRLQDAFDQCQRLGPEGTTETIPAASIFPGDRVLVRAEDPIPVDGRIVDGQAFIRETPLTGEPYPVVRREGDRVLAGSYSEDGQLIIEATVPGAKRQIDTLLSALAKARELPSEAQSQADRIVGWFLPLVVTMATGTFVYWTWREGFGQGLFNAMAVLLVACPCAMGLATPVALWNAMAVLASRGLVVKNGQALDRLAQIDHLVFDKTGTLSEDALSLIDIASLKGAGERLRLLAILGAVQNQTSHPVARAFHGLSQFVPAAGEEADRVQVRSLKTVPGGGIESWVVLPTGKELHLRAGQREFMRHWEGEDELLRDLKRNRQDHLVYVELDGRLEGIAAVRERLRPTVETAMQLCQGLGLHCSVFTGDHPQRARQLGLDHVEGGLSPTEKAERIQSLQRQNKGVGFVGDGINDAPAIHAATVGIALAHGAGVTTAHADATLYGGDLGVIPWAVALCRQVRSSIRANLVFAAVYNGFGILLAATGILHPVAAALLMVLSSFTVSWRALRSTDQANLCCEPVRPASNPLTGKPATYEPADGGRSSCDASAQTKGFSFSRQGAEDAEFPLSESRIPLSTAGLAGARPSIAPRFTALLFIAQIPFLIYLGQLDWFRSMAVWIVFVSLALALTRTRSSDPETRHWQAMTLAMLGPGNWGMILGWWADLGFVAFQPTAPCCSHAGGWGGTPFLTMPWMYSGMLLLGLPPMMTGPTPPRGLNRFALALLSSIGMGWGMALGNHLALAWLHPQPANRFLVSFAGMTTGMLLGMFFCCELGRAISLWLRAGSRRERFR